MRGSTLFREALTRQGVRYLFGILGREAEVLRLRDARDLRWILVRHEFTAAVAAEVYGRLTGRTQAAFSTVGPGAMNLAAGVASAYMDRAPLLALSAQVERRHRLFGQTHQCLDQVAVMRPITKLAEELDAAEQIPSAVQRALKAALAEPRGPSFLSLPMDLFQEEVPEAKARRLLAGLKEARAQPAPAPEPALIGEAASLIRGSRRPIIIAGNEVAREGAGKALAAFSSRLRIPIVETLASKGIVPESHPFNLGAVNRYLDSIVGTGTTRRIFDPADLVILVGFDLSEDLNPEIWNPGDAKRVVRLGLTPNRASGRIRPELEVVGSLRKSLAALLRASGDGRAANGHVEFSARLRAARRGARTFPRHARRRPAGQDPCLIVGEVRRAIGPRGLLISDVGLHKQYAGLLSETSEPNTFLCSNGLATFGFALPAVLGARLACPDRDIVAVVGDGGFHSNSQDLETLVRYGLHAVFVVLADRSFGLIKHYQRRGGKEQDPRLLEFGPVDFAGLARANGCRGWRVDSLAAFSKTLRKALKGSGPAVIEIPVYYRY